MGSSTSTGISSSRSIAVPEWTTQSSSSLSFNDSTGQKAAYDAALTADGSTQRDTAGPSMLEGKWTFPDRSTDECIEDCRQQKTIRLFISSTFKDFTAERDAFNKSLFPRLHRYCLDRGYSFLPVELRWGILEEDSKSGKVCVTCIREALRCRPYFLCLLGERYGWCHATDPSHDGLERDMHYAEQSYPWVSRLENQSVTEIEIRAATLNNGGSTDTSHGWFFFRDPAMSQAFDKGEPVQMETEGSRHAREQLKQLKDTIRSAGWFGRVNSTLPT